MNKSRFSNHFLINIQYNNVKLPEFFRLNQNSTNSLSRWVSGTTLIKGGKKKSSYALNLCIENLALITSLPK